MRNKRSKVIGFAFAALVCVVGSAAFAHSTGNERRNGAQCDALKADPKYGGNEAAWCHTCIDGAPRTCGATAADGNKCHYHPGDPAGTRCRPDNGKP